MVAALQDPRKDVLTIRNLFPDRIAMRLDEPEQVDMVLGDGARDRGATCELISPDPATGAGVAFVRLEADPDPVRVRAGWISDADIRDLAAWCVPSLPSGRRQHERVLSRCSSPALAVAGHVPAVHQPPPARPSPFPAAARGVPVGAGFGRVHRTVDAWPVDHPAATENAAAVDRYARQAGQLDFAAPQDWMCEPHILARTGLSIREHQERTIASYLELRSLAPDLPFIPVVQGWHLADYLALRPDVPNGRGRPGPPAADRRRVRVPPPVHRPDRRHHHRAGRARAAVHGFGMKTSGLPRPDTDSPPPTRWPGATPPDRLRLPGCTTTGTAPTA